MIEIIGGIAFVAIVILILFLFGLLAVGSYFEIAAEIAEARARKALAGEAGTAGTTKIDPVHEHATRQGNAQRPPQ